MFLALNDKFSFTFSREDVFSEIDLKQKMFLEGIVEKNFRHFCTISFTYIKLDVTFQLNKKHYHETYVQSLQKAL